MKFKPLPGAERLHEVLAYDPLTGVLTWKPGNRRPSCEARFAGKPAGSVNRRGYVEVRVDGTLYMAHRLIWKMMTGKDPDPEVDHENRKHGDNRWDNLREASRSEQLTNTGLRDRKLPKGVYKSSRGNTYNAKITKDRKVIYLGNFSTIEEAATARKKAAEEIHGKFIGSH